MNQIISPEVSNLNPGQVDVFVNGLDPEISTVITGLEVQRSDLKAALLTELQPDVPAARKGRPDKVGRFAQSVAIRAKSHGVNLPPSEIATLVTDMVLSEMERVAR